MLSQDKRNDKDSDKNCEEASSDTIKSNLEKSGKATQLLNFRDRRRLQWRDFLGNHNVHEEKKRMLSESAHNSTNEDDVEKSSVLSTLVLIKLTLVSSIQDLC